jgi:hypothetical protein
MKIKQCFAALLKILTSRKPNKKLSYFCLLLLSFEAHAQFNDLNFGAGLMNQSIGKFQSDTDGSRSKFNHRLTLEASLEYELSPDFFLSSDLGALWPGGSDEEYIKKSFPRTHCLDSLNRNSKSNCGENRSRA